MPLDRPTQSGRRGRTLLAFALTLLALMAASPAAAIPEPDDDPFYVAPAGFESKTPGTILRTRSVVVTALGIPIPVKSTQMLLRSTDAKGQPVAVVSTLMVPQTFYLGKRPLLSYQPATDSLGDQCNPSYLLRVGLEKEVALISSALSNGWAVVVTDYQGPRDAFSAGHMAGHATLDGIRAAERLAGTGLAGVNTPVGMWGYSGGGLATSWAAELQPSYAPELKIKGIVTGGTPADLRAAGETMDGGIASGLFLAACVGMSREYPEILDVLDADGERLLEDIGDKCYAEATASYPFRSLSEFTIVPDPLDYPVVADVLAQNKLGSGAPSAPVYMFHSLFDELIPYEVALEFRDAWCGNGAKVLFDTYYGGEHIAVAITGGPAALSFLGARFLGLPAPDNCD